MVSVDVHWAEKAKLLMQIWRFASMLSVMAVTRAAVRMVIFYLNVLQSMLFSSVCIYIKILKIASALSAFVPP
jgi:hypothetical protein